MLLSFCKIKLNSWKVNLSFPTTVCCLGVEMMSMVDASYRDDTVMILEI